MSLLQASFCLEDNDCENVEEKYKCDNYGDQVRSFESIQILTPTMIS